MFNMVPMSLPKEHRRVRKRVAQTSRVCRTVVAFGRRVPLSMHFGSDGPFPVHVVVVAAVEGAVVKAGLGVLLQLLGQVGAGRAGGNIVLVTILWIVQLFDKAHWPGK